jgi:hypothetical protein
MEGDFIYKRSKSCANVTVADSRQFCDKLTGLKKQKAALEEYNFKADAIAKLQEKVDSKRSVVNETKRGESFAYAQNVAIAGIPNWSGEEPTDVQKQRADKAINTILALLLWIVPTVLAVLHMNVIKYGGGSAPVAPKQHKEVWEQEVPSAPKIDPRTMQTRREEATATMAPIDIHMPVTVRHDVSSIVDRDEDDLEFHSANQRGKVARIRPSQSAFAARVVAKRRSQQIAA